MTLSPRKRPSNDDNEFMPVTKKLNLLSIDNSRESTNDSSYSREDEHELNSNGALHNVHLNHHSTHHNPYLHHYNPSLSSTQNPHYYESNRILFEAHQMRIARMQIQIPKSRL